MSSDVASSPDDNDLLGEAFDHRGEGVVRVQGMPELSQGFAEDDEAVLVGRDLAAWRR